MWIRVLTPLGWEFSVPDARLSFLLSNFQLGEWILGDSGDVQGDLENTASLFLEIVFKTASKSQTNIPTKNK